MFDVFSEIGGVIQFIFYVFYWVNYAYNKYIIAYDINSLFFSIRDIEKNSKLYEYKNNLNKNCKQNIIEHNIFNIKNNIINIQTNKNRNSKSNQINNINQSHNKNIDLTENCQIKNKEQFFENILDKTINQSNNQYYPNSMINSLNINKQNLAKEIQINNKKVFTERNSSNIELKENNNININRLIKYNKSSFQKESKNKCNSVKDYLTNIDISKNSILKIPHVRQNTSELFIESEKPKNIFLLLIS